MAELDGALDLVATAAELGAEVVPTRHDGPPIGLLRPMAQESAYRASLSTSHRNSLRAVARALGAPNQKRVSVQRDGLMQKRLIWSPRRGRVDLPCRCSTGTLRENHPL